MKFGPTACKVLPFEWNLFDRASLKYYFLSKNFQKKGKKLRKQIFMRKFALAFIMAKMVKEKEIYKHINYNRKENQQPT